MIFATVGTHEAPFDRLVRAMEAIARATDEEVVVQRGTSREPAPHCTVHELLPPREVDLLVTRARVVVTHAGPASLFLAWSRGHAPIVVPRDPALGEHVDDHQLLFARRIADRVRVITDTGVLAAAIAAHGQGAPRGDRRRTGRSERFADDLEALIARLLRERGRRRRRLRATVALFAGRGVARA